MTESENIAELRIYAVSESGKSGEIRLVIGMPYETDSGAWACPLAMEGIHERLNDVRGRNSWEALILAVQLIKVLLRMFVERNNIRLFSEEGGEEVSIERLFWDESNDTLPEIPVPDGEIPEEYQKAVDALTPEQIQTIDREILANCSQQWRKVARVVGESMRIKTQWNNHLPDIFYAQRVYHLVQEGKLEYEGRLGYMRFCEVRVTSFGQGADNN